MIPDTNITDYTFADVWVPLSVSGAFTYRIKKEHAACIKVGKRVLVNFGKKKLYAAVVVRLHNQPPKEYEAKYIIEILDDVPVLNEKNLRFWEWMAQYYLSEPGEVLRVAMPSGFKIQSDTRYTLETEKLNYVNVNTEDEKALLELFHEKKNIRIEDVHSHPLKEKIKSVFKNWLKSGIILPLEEWDEKYKPKIVSYVRINPDRKIEDILTKLEKKSFKQLECILYLLKEEKSNNVYEEGWMEKSKLSEMFDSSIVRALIKKDILEEVNLPISRLNFKEINSTRELILSEDQEKAYNRIVKEFRENKVVLLDGVTGSGKTEIFIRLIKDTIEKGQQVLYLLPEIALTIHHVNRLREYFGNKVGIYHSRFNFNERVEIWQKVLENNQNTSAGFPIILAPRSGIFLPFEKLGLIVVDEEHDPSYKQQLTSPRYHARDVALYLGRHIFKNCNVILGSATPSLESIYLSYQNRYSRILLRKKFHNIDSAPLLIVDLNKEINQGFDGPLISEVLKEKIHEVLSRKQQVLLFMGRRGYAPYYKCRTCHRIKFCRHCDVPMVYHKNPGHLLCHYCGYAIQPTGVCDYCGSHQLSMEGSGTEKIEELISVMFKNYRVERMDLDNTRSKHAFENILDRFEKKEIDILVGTNLITTGLDFSDVGLVALLNFDRHLHFPDFRSYERAFQLAEQLRGRTNRKYQSGTFIVQTYQPEHPILKYLINGDRDGFYHFMLEQRRIHKYPPYYRITELDVISEKKEWIEPISIQFKEIIHSTLPDDLKNSITILGPEWPLISKIKNKYIKRFLIKFPRGADLKLIHQWFRLLQRTFYNQKEFKNVMLSWNQDPY